MVLCDRGHENTGGARFCKRVRVALVVRCPTCGHAKPAASRFCSECATSFADGAAAAAMLRARTLVLDRGVAVFDQELRACQWLRDQIPTLTPSR